MARTRQARPCTARSSRTGHPCQAWAMVGQTTCSAHGGRAPQARAAAERRIAMARLEVAVARAMAETEYQRALLHAARAEIAGQLLGIEPERVTRLDILRSHRKFGQPIPWDDYAQRDVS